MNMLPNMAFLLNLYMSLFLHTHHAVYSTAWCQSIDQLASQLKMLRIYDLFVLSLCIKAWLQSNGPISKLKMNTGLCFHKFRFYFR